MSKKIAARIFSILLIGAMALTFALPNTTVFAASGKNTKSVTVNKTITVKTSKKIKKVKASKKGIVKVTFQKKAKKFKVKGLKKGKVTLTVTYTNKKKAKYQITVNSAKTTSATKSPSATKTPSVSKEEQVVTLVNKERAKAGLNKLEMDTKLQTAAAKRAKELKTLFSHSRPDGSLCFTVLNEYNVIYMAAGENIAMGQTTPEAVMNSWMNSEGHRANILSGNFTKIGVGCYQYNGRLYWVQLFIGD